MRKMVKGALNHIPENMIGLAQTPREMHQDGLILIFPAVLITLTQYGLTILDSGFN